MILGSSSSDARQLCSQDAVPSSSITRRTMASGSNASCLLPLQHPLKCASKGHCHAAICTLVNQSVGQSGELHVRQLVTELITGCKVDWESRGVHMRAFASSDASSGVRE